jgi:hypothetical protein
MQRGSATIRITAITLSPLNGENDFGSVRVRAVGFSLAVKGIVSLQLSAVCDVDHIIFEFLRACARRLI